MAAYSAFFSSGLLAPHHYYQSRQHTPAPPSSPVLMPSSPGDPIDVDRSTPTPSNTLGIDTQATPIAAHLNVPAADRPRLRKRRSSVTLGVSPMNAIKSPMRSAGAALHRALNAPTTPSRSRSGSLNNDMFGGPVQQGNGVAPRKRSASGSVNIRPRRTLLRKAPSAPPPNAPLPDIPSLEAMSPTLGYQSLSAPMQTTSFPAICVSTPQKSALRPPLTSRFCSADNNSNSVTYPSSKATTGSPDTGLSAVEKGYSDSVYTIDEEMKEN